MKYWFLFLPVLKLSYLNREVLCPVTSQDLIEMSKKPIRTHCSVFTAKRRRVSHMVAEEFDLLIVLELFWLRHVAGLWVWAACLASLETYVYAIGLTSVNFLFSCGVCVSFWVWVCVYICVCLCVTYMHTYQYIFDFQSTSVFWHQREVLFVLFLIFITSSCCSKLWCNISWVTTCRLRCLSGCSQPSRGIMEEGQTLTIPHNNSPVPEPSNRTQSGTRAL